MIVWFQSLTGVTALIGGVQFFLYAGADQLFG